MRNVRGTETCSNVTYEELGITRPVPSVYHTWEIKIVNEEARPHRGSWRIIGQRRDYLRVTGNARGN